MNSMWQRKYPEDGQTSEKRAKLIHSGRAKPHCMSSLILSDAMERGKKVTRPLGRKGTSLLSKRQNVAPATETTVMLELMLDGKQQKRKIHKKSKMDSKRLVTKYSTPTQQIPVAPATQGCVFMSGSLSDAKTFHKSKPSFHTSKRMPAVIATKTINDRTIASTKFVSASRSSSDTNKLAKTTIQSSLVKGSDWGSICRSEINLSVAGPDPLRQTIKPKQALAMKEIPFTNVTKLNNCSVAMPQTTNFLSLNVHPLAKKRPIERDISRRPPKHQAVEKIVPNGPEKVTLTEDTAINADDSMNATSSFNHAVPNSKTDILTLAMPLKTIPPLLNTRSVLEEPTQVSFDSLTLSSIKKTKSEKRESSGGNFVRLNMKNKAGSCRGAKKKSKWTLKREEWKESKERPTRPCIPRPQVVDPVDEFLDGSYNVGVKKKDSSIPCCGGHQRPCKQLIVKKTGGNKGRKFYVCSLPKGEQCDFFEWEDNSTAAAKEALLKKSTFSGFIARQVSSYVDRFRMLTVPELKIEAKKRGLNLNGKKQEILMRLSLFVRDELAQTETDQSTPVKFLGDRDDSSTSSTELKIYEASDTVDKLIHQSPADVLNSDSEESDVDDELEVLDSQKASYHEDLREFSAPWIHQKEINVEECLIKVFGHTCFREGQRWAIDRCLSQERSLLVAPTGFGKSLCYALPAALLDGTTIVISPLISLIEDQLRQLPPRVPSATLSGGMSASAMACTIDDVLKGRIKILFVSPERLTTPSFRRLFKQSWNHEKQTKERRFPPVSLLCIDEAHCMSQWAHNFRPSYLRIRSLLEIIEPKSILAVTATAGPPIVRDICRYLEIPHDDGSGVKILKSDRDNIDVFCKVLENAESRLLLAEKLLSKPPKKRCNIDFKDPIYDGCLADSNAIVYVWRQKDVEVVSEALMAAGVEGGIVGYHGGMDSTARSRAQSRFLRGKARICVATVAFGMGVNKVDIDAVIHLNLPSSLEHYLQEIGRAGRDGRPAKAISLPVRDEVILRHSLAHSNLISQSQVLMLLRILEAQIKEVKDDLELPYIEANQLRIFVGIPLNNSISSLDCKVETIETLLSLLEGDSICKSFARFEGRVNETATIVLKRNKLDNLELREQVARCISKCGRQLDESTGGEDDKLSYALRNVSNREYGFGTYQFSVSRCTNLMGPSAEPRHVYAALRRLQSQGELELIFDTDGYSLQMEVDATGLGDEKEITKLAEKLWNQFSNQIINTASKVRTIDSILRAVASTEDDGGSKEEKSARLIRFQEMATAELSKSEETLSQDVQTCDAFCLKDSSMKELMYDAQSVVHQIVDVISQATVDNRFAVRFDHNDFMDYTALTVTKFLHGIDTIRTSLVSKHHPLFGKWRHCDFASARSKVRDSLNSLK